jgi:hypothetical protein
MAGFWSDIQRGVAELAVQVDQQHLAVGQRGQRVAEVGRQKVAPLPPLQEMKASTLPSWTGLSPPPLRCGPSLRGRRGAPAAAAALAHAGAHGADQQILLRVARQQHEGSAGILLAQAVHQFALVVGDIAGVQHHQLRRFRQQALDRIAQAFARRHQLHRRHARRSLRRNLRVQQAVLADHERFHLAPLLVVAAAARRRPSGSARTPRARCGRPCRPPDRCCAPRGIQICCASTMRVSMPKRASQFGVVLAQAEQPGQQDR